MTSRFAIPSFAIVVFVAIADMPLGLAQAERTSQQTATSVSDQLAVSKSAEDTIRIATFNVSLYRKSEGQLAEELAGTPSEQIERLVQIIQAVKPDILLCNEVDYDKTGFVAKRLMELFNRSDVSADEDSSPILFTDWYSGPVNTGMPSEMDLNRDGRADGPNDAWGYGTYPGQYGMAVLSRFPIDREAIRSFQMFRWSRMPDAKRPTFPSGESYYDDKTWEKLRLSSKSHWDVPIDVNGKKIHVLALHPTPPVFDGPEDKNGCRNHDEIRMIVDYISGSPKANYLVDDNGQEGGLDDDSSFVVMGDLNADPKDGNGIQAGILSLLDHPRVSKAPAPISEGAVEAAKLQGGANEQHRGDPKYDTSDFGDGDRGSGNIRCDYVLPSADLKVLRSGVFWPTKKQLEAIDPELVDASDHRLVWIDVRH